MTVSKHAVSQIFRYDDRAWKAVDYGLKREESWGLIGPNGDREKTTALNAIGLTPYQGRIKVLGATPPPLWTERDQVDARCLLPRDVADAAEWIRVLAGLGHTLRARIRDLIARKQKDFWRRPPSSAPAR